MTPVDHGGDPGPPPQLVGCGTLRGGGVGHRQVAHLVRVGLGASGRATAASTPSERDASGLRVDGARPKRLGTCRPTTSLSLAITTHRDVSPSDRVVRAQGRVSADRQVAVRPSAAGRRAWRAARRRPRRPGRRPRHRVLERRCTRPRARCSLAALDRGYADPRRLHGAGRDARLLLDNAREATADALGRAARRGHLHRLAAPTRCTAGCSACTRAARAAATAIVHSAVEHSAVLHAVGLGGRAARRGPRRPVGSRRPARPSSRRLAARTSRSSPCQSANHEVGHRPAGRPRSRRCRDGVPLFVDACASMGRLPLPDGWAAAAGSAHKWGGPAGRRRARSSARARGGATPSPATTASTSASTGFENVPAALAAAAALQAVVAERDEVNARQHALVDRIRAGVRRGPRRRGRRRPRRPAPPPGDLLLPLRRRRGPGDRARPARLRRRQRVGLHRLDPRRRATCWRRWACSPTATCGVSLHARHHRGRRRRASCAALPEVVARDPRARWACDGDARRRPRARLPRDARARCRSSSSARHLGDVEVGELLGGGRPRPRGARSTSRRGAG